MTFSGDCFFLLKVPEFLHLLVNLVVKDSPIFFWLLCTLFLRNTRTTYQSVNNECNNAEQKEFFLLCLRFIFFFRFVGNFIQTSADDVIISQL